MNCHPIIRTNPVLMSFASLGHRRMSGTAAPSASTTSLDCLGWEVDRQRLLLGRGVATPPLLPSASISERFGVVAVRWPY